MSENIGMGNVSFKLSDPSGGYPILMPEFPEGILAKSIGRLTCDTVVTRAREVYYKGLVRHHLLYAILHSKQPPSIRIFSEHRIYINSSTPSHFQPHQDNPIPSI